jgi:hypothetical protein
MRKASKDHRDNIPVDGTEREIGHGNVIAFNDGAVEMRHFGKTVKRFSRREFIAELPLLAYILGREATGASAK